MQLARDLTTNTEEMIGTLSLSDLKLIQLARAFIFDPEVLVIHSPTLFLADEEQKLVLAVLPTPATQANWTACVSYVAV